MSKTTYYIVGEYIQFNLTTRKQVPLTWRSEKILFCTLLCSQEITIFGKVFQNSHEIMWNSEGSK